MNTCPTVKEISIPGCYTGVLKVNTGLVEGTTVLWKIAREGGLYTKGGVSVVDTEGNITLDAKDINYFNSYKLAFKSETLEDINIKGYDCYRLIPFKNTNEVVDVII